jgi:1,4-alpha-glucan branching enzyme
VCLVNLAPVPREDYRVGLPAAGEWVELLNTDSTHYGGTGVGNLGVVRAEERAWHDLPYSAEVTLPPLGAVWLRPADVNG